MIFTALLSVAFLGSKISKHMWFGKQKACYLNVFVIIFLLDTYECDTYFDTGMGLVFVGLVLVGVSDIVFNSGADSSLDVNSIITGDLLIVMAQVIVAIQMVYEQKVLAKYNVPPLQAVGLEGNIQRNQTVQAKYRYSCDDTRRSFRPIRIRHFGSAAHSLLLHSWTEAVFPGRARRGRASRSAADEGQLRHHHRHDRSEPGSHFALVIQPLRSFTLQATSSVLRSSTFPGSA